MKWKFPQINRHVITCFIVLLIAAGLVAGCGSGNPDKEVVASVNGEKISKGELYNLLLKQNGQQAVDSLIAQKVIELEAKKQKITASDKEIQKELEKYYESYGGQEAFSQTIKASGYSLDDIKKDLALNIITKKLLEPRISITEEERKTYFEENKATFAKGEQVRARHILVKTQEKANEIRDKLARGADFAQLAKENSIDPGTKNSGGELGFFGSGQMVKEFEQAAFALKVGEISAPVKTEYGYHIIQVEEKKAGQAANYEQSKDQITNTLREQKMQTEYEPWLQELKGKYKIENFLAKK